MRIRWQNELPMWLLLAGMLALAGLTWPGSPDRIPVHWNLHMQVDRYGGRFEGLLGIPLLALVIYVLMLLLPRIDPGGTNYAGFWGAFTTLRLALMTFFAALYGVIHLWLRGVQVRVDTVVPLLVGALFVVVGNLLGKVRPNWFVGIRTPWTLSSKDAWVRTHRVGGWVFVAEGLVFMTVGLLRVPWAFVVAISLLVAGLVGLFVYSYLVWRRDPEKLPPAGTSPA